MTTTAPPVSGLEVVNADAMDLLSDSGYDLGGDGNIDLDLSSTNDNQHQEDDALSLQDAGTDGGVDLHTASGDQDDFMVDKEDIIEEDEIDYSDLELDDAGQSLTDNSQLEIQYATNEHSGVPDTAMNPEPNLDDDEGIEEDLIDYSDEEGQQEEGVRDVQDEQEYDASVVVDDHEHGLAADASQDFHVSAHGSNEYVFQGEAPVDLIDEAEQPWNEETETSWEQPTNPDQEANQLGDDDRENNQEQGRAQVEEDDDNHEGEPNIAQEQQNKASQDAHSTSAIDTSQDTKSEQRQRLHPVTINYDGSELWLFKPHDTEDGEWLLSDESVAAQQFPFLFHACRAQLGDDINNETELGFRFDNFHALELFEDCTACAYASLKDLLDIYLGLHAQDGQTHPEPFYVTLQFRPRVVSLLNELKKAVQDQIGFSGLNSAVAAGQTGFNAYLSNHSDTFEEQYIEEAQETDVEEKHGSETREEDEAQLKQGRPGSAYANSHVEEGDTASVAAEGNDTNQVDTENIESGLRSPSSNQSSRNASAPRSHVSEEPEEDVIDYSEDEGAADVADAEIVSVNQPSSSSSTVQGDDGDDGDDGDEVDEVDGVSNTHVSVEDITNHTESDGDADKQSAHDEQDNREGNLDPEDNNEVADEDSYSHYHEDDVADVANHDNDQGFDQAFDQSFETGDHNPPDPNEQEGDYYQDNNGNVSFDEQADFNLARETEHFEAFGSATINDFLDLSGVTTNDASYEDTLPDIRNEDEINYDDDEGAMKQSTDAASSAVPPVVTSSTGLDNRGSPQGQKRPIDKVDIGWDGASDTTDAKRPKL